MSWSIWCRPGVRPVVRHDTPSLHSGSIIIITMMITRSSNTKNIWPCGRNLIIFLFSLLSAVFRENISNYFRQSCNLEVPRVLFSPIELGLWRHIYIIKLNAWHLWNCPADKTLKLGIINLSQPASQQNLCKQPADSRKAAGRQQVTETGNGEVWNTPASYSVWRYNVALMHSVSIFSFYWISYQ